MLLPSRWKGPPISVIEAMHLGIPVIASNVPGTDELVDDRTGRLIASEDVEGYAAAIRAILGDDALRRRMGATARDRARSRFSIHENVARHLALYRRVLGASWQARAA